jgi:hypothetical protein
MSDALEKSTCVFRVMMKGLRELKNRDAPRKPLNLNQQQKTS